MRETPEQLEARRERRMAQQLAAEEKIALAAEIDGMRTELAALEARYRRSTSMREQAEIADAIVLAIRAIRRTSKAYAAQACAS